MEPTLHSPIQPPARPGARARWLLALLVPLLLATPSLPGTSPTAPASALAGSALEPLPEDRGEAGLQQMLLRLKTTARLLHIDAHPDDEDGGMLTLESRGRGAAVVLLTLNRGEGGQNKVGSNLFDVLGVLRTLELTAADRYYGVEQRFSRVTDFGFSKSAEETFEKWQGHEIALADMVEVIRRFQPQVIVSRFSGTERDGHGNHQASGILAREAFRAAADPARFPAQIRGGLAPWQASKLYLGNVCGFGATSCPADAYTVKLNTGQVDRQLGMSYAQFAMQGLKHQLSQGAGSWSLEPGDRFSYYRLVDSVPAIADGKETDFFDGIDTSLQGLSRGLASQNSKLAFLAAALAQVSEQVRRATSSSSQKPGAAVAGLSQALVGLDGIRERLAREHLEQARPDLSAALTLKQQQAESALALALSLSLEATSEPRVENQSSAPVSPDSQAVLSPGQSAQVNVQFHNGSDLSLRLESLSIESPVQPGRLANIPLKPDTQVEAGGSFSARVALRVPEGFEYTRPYWHRDHQESDGVYTLDQPKYSTLPFPPPPFLARAVYLVPGQGNRGQTFASVAIPIVARFEEEGKSRPLALSVAPLFSLSLEPGEQVLAAGRAVDQPLVVKVGLESNALTPCDGLLRLRVPAGWRVDPSAFPVRSSYRGQTQDFSFSVHPSSLREGKTQIAAAFESGDSHYAEGYSLVSRPDLDAFYYYQPAVQRVSVVDTKVPSALQVAYVMGAGDAIPTVLEQLGLKVTLLAPGLIKATDLSQYGTIVLGIRAYDTQNELVANNRKLLDYVFRGGTLVVQYNSGVNDFNQEHLTPYPAELSRERVSVEQAPVEILDPADSVFHSPNEITARDFEGWVQERGLYFWSHWDDHFRPLISSHDPGETALQGGLLRAPYGKGTYIYTGYAFFRQLPAGVPGAIRLYMNLLAAGH